MTIIHHIRDIALFLALLFLSFAANSQDLLPDNSNHTSRGDHLLYGGVGFVNPEAFTFNIFSASGGGNPTVSANLNYQYAIHDRFLVGAFTSYYRVNADYNTSFEDLAELFEEITLDDLLNNFDCIVLGNCSTTITERVSVFSVGGKFSYTKNIAKEFETYMSAYLGYSFNRRKTLTESALDLISAELDLGVKVPTFIYFSSVGVRYYFSSKWAIQGEFGYGNSHLINVGVSYKL